MAEERQEQQPQDVRLGWRRRLVLLLFLIGIGGVLIRMKGGESAKEITPFITECALAMLIGIGLGLATRSVAKLLIFIITAGFVGLQVLAYMDLLKVNWPAIDSFLKESVLIELKEMNVGSILQHKLPSFGALMIGYLFGLKRG